MTRRERKESENNIYIYLVYIYIYIPGIYTRYIFLIITFTFQPDS